MENIVDNSNGTAIPRKSRSLDLKSLYKSSVSQEVQYKRKVSAEDGDEWRNGKKSKKEVSLSNFRNVNSNRSRKSLKDVYDGGLSSGGRDSKDLKSWLSQKLKSRSGFKKVQLSLDDNMMQIPKRKRGLVGKKKFLGGQVLELAAKSGDKVGLVDPIAEVSSDDLAAESDPLRINQKKCFDGFKENRKTESDSARNLKGDEHTDQLVVNSKKLPLKRSQKNSRKPKDVELCSRRNAGDAEAVAVVGNCTKKCTDSHDDDEENLEENAARMLSSRFDPSCTGFSSNSKTSSLPSSNGLSFVLSSAHDIVSSGSKSPSGSDSGSVDTAGRVLRPRKKQKEKGSLRKRRHFYEVLYRDLDAQWVLNRRIKVFWPLDQSWYFGLVNDYDSERKLHHVKYDDRDEEWIDLQNERFKLLLLPSEVPGKAERKRSVIRNRSSDHGKGGLGTSEQKKKRDFTMEDDSFVGSYMDSEPIISWLARSTHSGRFPPSRALKKRKSLNSGPPLLSGERNNTHESKFSSSQTLKKQKTSDLSLNILSPLSEENTNLHESSTGCSFKRNKRELSSNGEFPGRLKDAERLEKSASESTTYSKDSKLPIVYFRRRFRKTGNELHTLLDDYVSGGANGSVSHVSSVVDEIEDLREQGIFLGRLKSHGLLWSMNDAGLVKLTLPLMEPGQLRFELSLPIRPFINDSFKADDFWLFRTALLLQYGTVMTMWPKVHLEILFVDNKVGLRFLLFEGCLTQAVAFVFLILAMFYSPGKQVKHVDLQLPVTSIRFKFSCVENIRKQLVFALYNFSEIKNSKWNHLDSRLKRHCSLTKELPLLDCTYDNIKALENGRNQITIAPACMHCSCVKGIHKKYRQGVNIMGVCSEASFVNISLSSSRGDETHRNISHFALSFTASPTFFLSLHHKLLMKHCWAHPNLQDTVSAEHPENCGSLMMDDCSSFKNCPNKGSEFAFENSFKTSLREFDGRFSSAPPELGSRLSDCNGDWVESNNYQNDELKIAEISAGCKDPEKVESDVIEQWQNHHFESEQFDLKPVPLGNVERSNTVSHSVLDNLSVEIPPFNEFEKPEDGELHSTQQSMDLSWNMNAGVIPSPNPTAPRSTWHRNRNNLSSFGFHSHGWSDRKFDFFNDGFGNGPKKPRTQVSYLSPFGGFCYSSKNRNQHQKVIPHKRIRRANEKRLLDVSSKGSQRNLELLSCEANVLITLGDRGWRECGARVVLELSDHNEWKLAVKLSGATKYSYKAHQLLQPGSTNRYTHAMMWKGGKDWTLEFPDRSQWALFKEMYEECCNRNIRAAVKNIPIPGVRLIEESIDEKEAAFVRSSSKYFRQVQTDVEMALDSSRILYDMDSDDERWMMNNRDFSEAGSSGSGEVSDEMFEKTMDMFEKAAYAQQRDQFTSDEIEELVGGAGNIHLIKRIYEYWQQKRRRKGMPLIRHLQPPLWERYQQQLREWELAVTRNCTALSNGCQEKAASVDKPPMHAFCLKPRGLEDSNKGLKQRSHRKLSVAFQSHASSGDQDGLHGFGRRLNGFASLAEEKVAYPGYNYELLDDSLITQTSPRACSPRDGVVGYLSMSSDRLAPPKLYRSKSTRFGSLLSPSDPHQRVIGKRNGVSRWNMGYYEWPSQQYYQNNIPQRHVLEQLDGSDLDEFTLRDASGAAKHALNMAKLKREKAQRLLYQADLAIHKAVVALMTAEAIKASSEEPNGDDSRIKANEV